VGGFSAASWRRISGASLRSAPKLPKNLQPRMACTKLINLFCWPARYLGTFGQIFGDLGNVDRAANVFDLHDGKLLADLFCPMRARRRPCQASPRQEPVSVQMPALVLPSDFGRDAAAAYGSKTFRPAKSSQIANVSRIFFRVKMSKLLWVVTRCFGCRILPRHFAMMFAVCPPATTGKRGHHLTLQTVENVSTAPQFRTCGRFPAFRKWPCSRTCVLLFNGQVAYDGLLPKVTSGRSFCCCFSRWARATFRSRINDQMAGVGMACGNVTLLLCIQV